MPCNICIVSLSSTKLPNVVGLEISVSCFQNDIDILLYSYLCICLDSIWEYDVVFPFNFFDPCFQGGRFLICYPLLHISSELFFSFKRLFVWLIFFVCLCEDNLFFISDIRRRCGLFNECCLGILPDSETYYLRDSEFQSGKKISRSVDLTSLMWSFEVQLQYKITCIPHRWRNCLCLEKTCDGVVVCEENFWLCCLPQNVCKLQKCHVNCQTFFWVYRHLELLGGENFWAMGAYVFRFDCIF